MTIHKKNGIKHLFIAVISILLIGSAGYWLSQPQYIIFSPDETEKFEKTKLRYGGQSGYIVERLLGTEITGRGGFHILKVSQYQITWVQLQIKWVQLKDWISYIRKGAKPAQKSEQQITLHNLEPPPVLIEFIEGKPSKNTPLLGPVYVKNISHQNLKSLWQDLNEDKSSLGRVRIVVKNFFQIDALRSEVLRRKYPDVFWAGIPQDGFGEVLIHRVVNKKTDRFVLSALTSSGEFSIQPYGDQPNVYKLQMPARKNVEQNTSSKYEIGDTSTTSSSPSSDIRPRVPLACDLETDETTTEKTDTTIRVLLISFKDARTKEPHFNYSKWVSVKTHLRRGFEQQVKAQLDLGPPENSDKSLDRSFVELNVADYGQNLARDAYAAVQGEIDDSGATRLRNFISEYRINADAQIVVLAIPKGPKEAKEEECGRASDIPANDSGFFAVVWDKQHDGKDCNLLPDRVVSHEIAHLLGARHQLEFDLLNVVEDFANDREKLRETGGFSLDWERYTTLGGDIGDGKQRLDHLSDRRFKCSPPPPNAEKLEKFVESAKRLYDGGMEVIFTKGSETPNEKISPSQDIINFKSTLDAFQDFDLRHSFKDNVSAVNTAAEHVALLKPVKNGDDQEKSPARPTKMKIPDSNNGQPKPLPCPGDNLNGKKCPKIRATDTSLCFGNADGYANVCADDPDSLTVYFSLNDSSAFGCSPTDVKPTTEDQSQCISAIHKKFVNLKKDSNKEFHLVLDGHADSSGSQKHNIGLSWERAQTVFEVGFPENTLPGRSAKIHICPYGNRLSFCSENSENRRVRIRKISIDQ